MGLLENELIRLRALEPEDLELLYRWENDPALWEVGNTLAPYSRYILKEYIASAYQSIHESGQVRLLVESRAAGAAVGLVDLFDFDPRHNRAACGVLLDPAWQGKGFATEAMRLMIGYAFSFLKIHSLYVHVPIANEPSRRLFARCGFKEAGILEDWIMTRNGYSGVRIMQVLADQLR